MAKDNKETFSPTLIQSFLYQNKSPLSAFGEGLFDVGKTNEQIHDTIWNHDLRKEQREREQFRFEMEKEAHRLKMAKEQEELRYLKTYGDAEHQAKIANTNAQTWNTNESALLTQQNRKFSADDRKTQEMEFLFRANDYADDYGIKVAGQIYLDELTKDANDLTAPKKKREEAQENLFYSQKVIGKMLANAALNSQRPNFSDDELKAFDRMGINPKIYKMQNGQIVSSNNNANAALHVVKFYADNMETFLKIDNGETTLQHELETNEKLKKSFELAASAYRNNMKNDTIYKKARDKVSQLNTFLEGMFDEDKGIKSVKDSLGFFDNSVYEGKKYFGGTNLQEQSFRILTTIYTAGKVKDFYGGNASNADRESIEKSIGSPNMDDLYYLRNMKKLLESDLRMIHSDIGIDDPVIAYAKYGDEYHKLKYLLSGLDHAIAKVEAKLNQNATTARVNEEGGISLVQDGQLYESQYKAD